MIMGTGTPAMSRLAKDCSALVVCVGVPCEMPRSTPYRTAFMPSVWTMGVMPDPGHQQPVHQARGQADAVGERRSRRRAWPEFPFGMRVTMTTVAEMKPGTDKSMPRCCTTSVCPTAARMSSGGERPQGGQGAGAQAARLEDRADREEQPGRQPDARRTAPAGQIPRLPRRGDGPGGRLRWTGRLSHGALRPVRYFGG